MRALALAIVATTMGLFDCTRGKVEPAAAPASTVAPESAAIVPDGSTQGFSLPFIENDYARAFSESRTKNLPLFVDAWAPWCHTCLSMRSYVFTDGRMQPLAKRFVWLSLDTERQENAPIVNRLGVRVLPTLFVIDPKTEATLLAWPGSLTAVELAQLLEDAQLGGVDERAPPSGAAAAALLRGHRAGAARDAAGAIAAYREALAAAPPAWPARPEAVDSLVTRLSDDKQLGECVTVAAHEVATMPPGTALADTLRTAMSCAEDLPPSAPERASLGPIVDKGIVVVEDAAQPLLADDRSDLYNYLVEALGNLGRPDDAKRLASSWVSFLEGEARRAPAPAARAVFDAHRLLAYEAIGEPGRAVPMLEQSERDFPDDYNPPARLGMAFFEMKRYDDALAALRRALSRAYGPRKLRLWSLEADVLSAKGDAAGARQALRDALDFAASVPLTGSYPALRDSLAQRLAALH